MKQRFSSLDVKVIAQELSQTLPSLRVSNIYDLSSRIFLFKLAKPGTKSSLLIDTGFRVHTTAFSRTTAAAPSAFVARLRKFLKSRRVTGVRQVGTDRIIEIEFSDGAYRLFLEFFAAGNIILTDSESNVICVWRVVSGEGEGVDVKLGGKYSLDSKQNVTGVPPVTSERLKECLEKQAEKAKIVAEAEAQGLGAAKKKRRKGGADDAKTAMLAGFPEFPSHLMDHAFRESGVSADIKARDALKDDTMSDQLTRVLETASDAFRQLETTTVKKGYIIAKSKEQPAMADDATRGDESVARANLLYDDYHPFKPSQFQDKPRTHILEFDGFNETVDEFYSSIESQKLDSRLEEREANAKRKLEEAKQTHGKRLGALQEVQELHVRKAQAIEANTHKVEEVTAAVNGLIAQGMDWMDIGKLIENEQSRNNAVAQLIKLPLKLYENTFTILLDEPFAEEEEEEDFDTDKDLSDSEDEATTKVKRKTSPDKRLAIDIDLALSPYANARQYYDQKKTAAVKEQKTIQASTKALKSTQAKIAADLKKGMTQEKDALRPQRRQMWFEKFLYFISSDGYLVLGGKDAQQNEILYRRYLKKGDFYVHADLQGASSVIVKNNPTTPDAPIPPSTLSQAGSLSVCSSSAWDSKAVMAAWWVNADQVSKTAPTGEYLTTGGFMIKGKKNFLPPSQLLLGFAVMFQISPESKFNHNKHRLPALEKTPTAMDQIQNGTAKLAVTSDERPEDDADTTIEEHDEQAGDESGIDDADQDTDAESPPSVIGSENARALSNPLQPDGAAAQNSEDDEDDDDGGKNGVESKQIDDDHVQAKITPHKPAGGGDQKSDNEESASEDDDEGTKEQELESNTTPGTSTPMSSAGPATAAAKNTNPKQVRGKRGKAKKTKQKYAAQDEDDRALAMQLLGSSKAQEKREAEQLSKSFRDAKAQADKERRRRQHEKAALLEKRRQGNPEAEGDDREDEESKEVMEQERAELLNIDALVAAPMPGDEILAAIPVCGPWSAVGRCKYKVKLQPGNVKKGKAVREMVGRWMEAGKMGPKVVDESAQDRERVWPREIECIRAWRVEEIFGLLPVKGCRIVQGGGLGGAAGGSKDGSKVKGGAGRSGRGSTKR